MSVIPLNLIKTGRDPHYRLVKCFKVIKKCQSLIFLKKLVRFGQYFLINKIS